MIFSFLAKKRETITTDFSNWYHNDVFMKLNPSMYKLEWERNWKIVEHVQEALTCCGIKGASDFQEYNHLNAADAAKLRMTCVVETKSNKGDNSIQRPEFYDSGCQDMLESEADSYIVEDFKHFKL